jgi:hypothetical protein
MTEIITHQLPNPSVPKRIAYNDYTLVNDVTFYRR